MRETILVVDDEADVVDLVRYHLNRAGFDVDVASSGMAALHTARQRRPDAIVLDIMLPQMSGTEVLQKLKLGIDTATIPVLMIISPSLLAPGSWSFASEIFFVEFAKLGLQPPLR